MILLTKLYHGDLELENKNIYTFEELDMLKSMLYEHGTESEMVFNVFFIIDFLPTATHKLIKSKNFKTMIAGDEYSLYIKEMHKMMYEPSLESMPLYIDTKKHGNKAIVAQWRLKIGK
jgi:hypothetical protein